MSRPAAITVLLAIAGCSTSQNGPTSEPLGRWTQAAPLLSGVVTIQQDPAVGWRAQFDFHDGSSASKLLRRVDRVFYADDRFGGAYTLLPDGRLQVSDREGVIGYAAPLR